MAEFDADTIDALGWRQGSRLGEALSQRARGCAPSTIAAAADGEWLIVVSHDCDVANGKLANEPTVEVLRAERSTVDKSMQNGRSPRALTFTVTVDAEEFVLKCRVHDRWSIPRQWLQDEKPAESLPAKPRRLIAEWLAKRYIRSAFPTAFDQRWRKQMSSWVRLLEKHNEWIQGVYLLLSSFEELPALEPYGVSLKIVVPHERRQEVGWADAKNEIDDDVTAFWEKFEPGIVLDVVDVLGTDEVTFADIDGYLRFDADWVSFADDDPVTPTNVDMHR